MADNYTIEMDADRRLMRVTLYGFWKTEMVAMFLEEVEHKEGKLRAAGKPYFVITDLTGFPVQTRAIADELEHHLKAWSNAGSYSAIVSSSVLAELQVKRIAEGGNRKYFHSDHDAIEWLVSMGMSARP
jgi:hypothetical protein